MAIEVFNRVEKKYLVSYETYLAVKNRLKEYTYIDPYNIDEEYYTISNIYYDTEDNRFVRHSVSHPIYKEKLRLRAYGVPKDEDKVYLEIKKKFRGTANKRRTAFYYQEAMHFLETHEMPEILPHMNGQVIRELCEFFVRNPKIEPAAYIAYDRMAFFAKDDASLRISFDKNIRTRRYDLELKLGDYGEPLISEDTRLMEIKASESYPMWLVKILSDYEIRRISFSKYGTEYMNMRKNSMKYIM